MPQPLNANLALAAQRQRDVLCDEFEQLLQANSRPQLKAFLGRVSDAEQSALLSELVALDCDYRRERGETPAIEDYLPVAPELAELIASLIAAPASARRAGKSNSAANDSTQARVAETHTFPPSSPDSPERLPEIPGYEVLDYVAQGGMGVVYRALDKRLEREVAIKLPRSGYISSEQEKDRFVREAVAAARLRHSNICPVFEVREAKGQTYIAMAFIRGVTLKVWRREALPQPRQIAEMMATIARAVQAAHDQDVIHRDLKPSNVMVEASSGQPILMDFGLAKDLSHDDGLTMTGDLIGTPAYMAPEQAAGQSSQVGKHSDVYALGAILYELLAGKAPFDGTLMEVLQKVQEVEPARIRRINGKVHRDLETICVKAMAKQAGERYATAGAFAEDLDRFHHSDRRSH